MYIMTTQAGRLLTQYRNVSHVSQNMAITRIQVFVIRLREVHLKVLKEIVTGDECVWIWRPERARLAEA